MDEEQERAAFEAWRLRTTKSPKSYNAIALEGMGDDAQYADRTTRAMWVGWIAALSQPASPAPEAASGPTEEARALDFLAGLHPCLTIDEPPMEVAERIFDAVLAERAALQDQIKNMERNLDFMRSALSQRNPASPAAPEATPPVPTVEQAITALVTALSESKGWMRDYADSIIRDAIDRKPSIYSREPKPYAMTTAERVAWVKGHSAGWDAARDAGAVDGEAG